MASIQCLCALEQLFKAIFYEFILQISMSVILIMVDVNTTVPTHKEAINVSVGKDMKLITMEETVQV